MKHQAMEGIRVLDLGTFIAGPFCATILGEFGADIIKVEKPREGDHLRRFGTDTQCGDTLLWLSEGRNKRSVTLDLGTARGRDLLRQLIETVDVVVENFRPGVLERWQLGYEQMAEVNPKIILVRISAYGQSGPKRDLPGFARIAHAFSGLAYLSGEAGRVPVTPGSTSLADYITGLYGALGVLLALRAREQTGRGQCIDLALYETVFRMLDEIAPAYQQFGAVRERMGPDTANVVPHGHFSTKDGKWVALACSNDEMFARLATAMGRAELAADDRYGRKQQRLANRDEVNRMVKVWTASLTCAEVIERCRSAQAPIEQLYSIADIFADSQYSHRGTIQLEDSRIGRLAVPGTLPRLSDTPGSINWLGPSLGEHNEDVLGQLLALSKEEIAELRGQGIV
jgi:crotonobetainyl-CoA:carnitine CoA-transferase CaiB-like acyl-CoA transferase